MLETFVNSFRLMNSCRVLSSIPQCYLVVTWSVRFRSSASRSTIYPKTTLSNRVCSDPDSLFRFDGPFKDPFPRDFGFHRRFKFYQGGTV